MKNFETQILKHHFHLKKSIRFSIMLMLLTILIPVLNAQPTITVTGGATSGAGTAAIPSAELVDVVLHHRLLLLVHRLVLHGLVVQYLLRLQQLLQEPALVGMYCLVYD